VQLAASLTGTRLVALAVACSAAFGLYRVWPAAAPDPVRAPAAPTYSYVPLLGDPTRSIEDSQARGGAGCAPFIAPLIAHPNWSLTIADGATGCTGEWIHNTYEVRADGSVLWSAPNMPNRVLQLTAPELALITRTNDFPCGRIDEVSYVYGWMRIAPSGDPRARGAAMVPSSSLAGTMLEAVMQGAIERYRTARRAEMGPFELHLRIDVGGTRQRIKLDQTGRLVIRRGDRALATRILDATELVDVFDFLSLAAIRRWTVTINPEGEPGVRGLFIARGVRHPIALNRWDDPQFRALWDTLADASELESRR
jgi:hypothetical protein